MSVSGLLQRSHFLNELTGQVYLTQHDAVASIDPELVRRTQEAPRAQTWGKGEET